MSVANQQVPEVLKSLLSHPKVKIRDTEAVSEKLSKLVAGGLDSLQVFSDFDFTISQLWDDHDVKCRSSHNVIEAFLPHEYCAKAEKILNKYYPIEIDPNLTQEEKTPLMVKWWTSSHENIVESGLTKPRLEEACRASGILVRDGFSLLVQSLCEHKVPLLIFSAGIADVLQGVLVALDLSQPNQTIIANRMNFDDEGRLVGFHDPLIHVFNKNEALKVHVDYFESQKGRKNYILMGDSLGDLKMVDGVSSVAHCLTIGFLNNHLDAMLDRYMDNFDIVLVDDRTMDVPNLIVKYISN